MSTRISACCVASCEATMVLCALATAAPLHSSMAPTGTSPLPAATCASAMARPIQYASSSSREAKVTGPGAMLMGEIYRAAAAVGVHP